MPDRGDSPDVEPERPGAAFDVGDLVGGLEDDEIHVIAFPGE
jgi:hypothetical protein